MEEENLIEETISTEEEFENLNEEELESEENE